MLKFKNHHEPAVDFAQFLLDIKAHREQAQTDAPEWYDHEGHIVGIHSGIYNGKRYYAVADREGIECAAIEIEEMPWETFWESDLDEEIVDE